MKPTEEVLQDLTQPSNVSVHSGVVLVGKVEAAIAADDKKRRENEDEPLRRKPVLAPIPQTELPRQFEVTLWDVLHTLARATALSWRGAGRGLAEHWGALKYTQALAGGRNSFLRLTDEGHRIADHYKSLQSGELGIGFALTLAEHMLRSRFPDHTVTIVPADTALRAGWALTSRDKGEKLRYRYRPQYFAEVWRPGEPSLVIPLACKGNHSDSATSAEQLASASAHAEAVHIGPWNETPGLLFSTQLPTDGGTMTVHALQAPGSGGWLFPAEVREPNLNAPPFQANVMPDIHPPTEGLVAPEPVRGCHVQGKDYAWFQESLAHTTAAGLMAFTSALTTSSASTALESKRSPVRTRKSSDFSPGATSRSIAPSSTRAATSAPASPSTRIGAAPSPYTPTDRSSPCDCCRGRTRSRVWAPRADLGRSPGPAHLRAGPGVRTMYVQAQSDASAPRLLAPTAPLST
ncbi:hypothetical protein [Streptomyces sp. NPDC054874]